MIPKKHKHKHSIKVSCFAVFHHTPVRFAWHLDQIIAVMQDCECVFSPKQSNANHLCQYSYQNNISVCFPSLSPVYLWYRGNRQTVTWIWGENDLKGGGGGMDTRNNRVLIPQEGKPCQMPPLSHKHSTCQERVCTSNSIVGEGNPTTYWPTKGDRRGGVCGFWVDFKQCIYKQYVGAFHQNVCEKQCTTQFFYSMAINVSARWSIYAWVCPNMTVIVCKSLWSDCLLKVFIPRYSIIPSL